MLKVVSVPTDYVPSELILAIGDYMTDCYEVRALEYDGEIIGYHVCDDSGVCDAFLNQDFEVCNEG